MKQITFREVTLNDDISEIVKVFVEHETLSKNCPLKDEDIKMIYAEFREKSIPQGYSMLAEDASAGDASNKICGLLIASHGTVDLSMIRDEELKSGNFKLIEEFDDYTEGLMPHVAETFNYLLLQICVVKSSHRRLKIAFNLVKEAEKKAVERKCKALILMATSEYSRKMFLKLGYEVVKEILYSEYTSESTGKRVFSHISGQHFRACMMIKNL